MLGIFLWKRRVKDLQKEEDKGSFHQYEKIRIFLWAPKVKDLTEYA